MITKIQTALESFRVAGEGGSLFEMMRFVDRCTPADLHTSFIDDYRNLIRRSGWQYNDASPIDHGAFCDEWLQAHRFYLETGFACYAYLANGVGDFKSILARVIRSETGRGRVGKRSRIGLDTRLDKAVFELETLLTRYFAPSSCEDLMANIVSTMPENLPTAETELCLLMQSPPISTLNGWDNRPELLGPPLREQLSYVIANFCRYSTADFEFKRTTLCDHPLRDASIIAAERKAAIRNALDKIQPQSESDAQKFITLCREIELLNYLNANLEVKYGFKSWPGLFHYLILKISGYDFSGDIHKFLSKTNIL